MKFTAGMYKLERSAICEVACDMGFMLGVVLVAVETKFSQDAIFALGHRSLEIAVIKAKARIELGPTTAARRLQLDRSTSDSASRHSA